MMTMGSHFKEGGMMKVFRPRLNKTQRHVLQMLKEGRILVSADTLRREPLHWLTRDGKRRTRGPDWLTVEVLELVGLVTVKVRRASSHRDLVVRLVPGGST